MRCFQQLMLLQASGSVLGWGKPRGKRALLKKGMKHVGELCWLCRQDAVSPSQHKLGRVPLAPFLSQGRKWARQEWKKNLLWGSQPFSPHSTWGKWSEKGTLPDGRSHLSPIAHQPDLWLWSSAAAAASSPLNQGWRALDTADASECSKGLLGSAATSNSAPLAIPTHGRGSNLLGKQTYLMHVNSIQ